jgi:hypothetical protein
MANFSHIRYNANSDTSQDNHTPFFPYFDFYNFNDPEIKFNQGYVFDYTSEVTYQQTIDVVGCEGCLASEGPFYVQLNISEYGGVDSAKIVKNSDKELAESSDPPANAVFIEICDIFQDGSEPAYIKDLKLRENIHFYGTGAVVEAEGDPCYLDVEKENNVFNFDIKIPDPPIDRDSVLVSYGGCSGFQWIEAPNYDESESSIYLFGYDNSTNEFKFFNTFECSSGEEIVSDQ